jgi:hypothetical protein
MCLKGTNNEIDPSFQKSSSNATDYNKVDSPSIEIDCTETKNF